MVSADLHGMRHIITHRPKPGVSPAPIARTGKCLRGRRPLPLQWSIEQFTGWRDIGAEGAKPDIAENTDR
jgi:hypothetical protein